MNKRIIDLTGKKFGRLIVLNISKEKKDNRITWKCKCECGNIKNVIGKALRNGTIKSCGCYSKEIIKNNAKKRFIDITGQKFNRLTVLNRSHNNKFNFIMWECLCDCGNKCFAKAYELKTEQIKSCGCLNNELRSKRVKTHDLSKTSLYRVWKSIKTRCLCKSNKNYKRYGGRGIIICNEWLNNPMKFIEWAKNNGYKKGLTIDRKNNNGNYKPSNCRFVSIKENNRNTSNCKVNYEIVIKIKEIASLNKYKQSEIGDMFGITQQTVSKIINNKTWY